MPPELLKILCEMGHGDEIVIADGNYPSASTGQRAVYLTGSGACKGLDAVSKFLPLDTYAQLLYLMAVTEGDTADKFHKKTTPAPTKQQRYSFITLI